MALTACQPTAEDEHTPPNEDIHQFSGALKRGSGVREASDAHNLCTRERDANVSKVAFIRALNAVQGPERRSTHKLTPNRSSSEHTA